MIEKQFENAIITKAEVKFTDIGGVMEGIIH